MLARIPLESAKTRDITGGLPRVAELFEARRPRITPSSRNVRHGGIRPRLQKKARITIVPMKEPGARRYLIPKGKHLSVRRATGSRRASSYGRHPAPHDILAIKGVEELAAYLVNEIRTSTGSGRDDQRQAYRSDRRPMLQKVEIEDAGDTTS